MDIKKKLVDNFINLLNNKWTTEKVKVLIYDNEIDRLRIFKEKQSYFEEKLKSFDFKYVKKKLHYLTFLNSADVIFSYGISSHLKFNNIKLIYIGQVGTGIPNNTLAQVKVVHTPNLVANFISEYVISAILSFEHRLHIAGILKNKKNWAQKPFTETTPRNIKDLKVGILGLGNVGSLLAKELKNFGCFIAGYDVKPKSFSFLDEFFDDENGLEQLLSYSDYIILTMNSNKDNYHFINKNRFNKINSNACLINVSRGQLIDDKALISALKNKTIRGAVLDVFDKEPLPRYSPLWRFDNVIITPHIAGNINYVFDKIADNFFNTLIKEFNV